MEINVFIPHRWNNEDYGEICNLLDKTVCNIRNYSVPKSDPFDSIDRRYNVDPQIKNQIKHATVVICSNRPANNNGIAIDEILYALEIGKPVAAVRITENTSAVITNLGIQVLPKRKDSLEKWIFANV